MKYKYSVNWDEEDKVFLGRVEEFPSLAAHGASAGDALREIVFAVDDVISQLRSAGEPIPEPTAKPEV